MIATRAERSAAPGAADMSMGCASSSGGVPRPRRASGAAIEPPAISATSSAHQARARGPNCARASATQTNSAEAPTSASAPLVISLVVAGSSTSVKVCTLPQMSAAPAAAAAAPNQTSTPTLSHAGENTSVENS